MFDELQSKISSNSTIQLRLSKDVFEEAYRRSHLGLKPLDSKILDLETTRKPPVFDKVKEMIVEAQKKLKDLSFTKKRQKSFTGKL